MDRRVYQVSFVVFLALTILLPTLTKQVKNGKVSSFYSDEERVLGVSCGGDGDLRSDLNCDGEIDIDDFVIWKSDYLNPPEAVEPTSVPEPVVTNTPIPTPQEVGGCFSVADCPILTVIGWSECNQVTCLGGECVYSMKGDGVSCTTVSGDGGSCLGGECGLPSFEEVVGECSGKRGCVACGNSCVLDEVGLKCLDVVADFSCECQKGSCVKVSGGV